MRATLFDFNGVLVDDEHVHTEAFREVLRPMGITFDDATYAERYLGFDDVGAFRAMLADHGHAADDGTIERLVAAKKPAYMRLVDGRFTIFEGAVELVRRRAAGAPVAIVSGALRDEIAFAVARMNLNDVFAAIVAAEDTARCKPDPEGYLLALRALGRAADSVVVLEDSLAGIAAARAAGLRCVGVAHSYAVDELVAAGADAVARTLAEVTDAMLDGGA